MQICNAGSTGFDACECDGMEISASATSPTTTSPTTTSPTTTEPTTDSSSGTPPECEQADDCVDLEPTECEEVACNDGMCVLQGLDAGTPCGDDTADECTEADTCDGNGACATNDAVDGFDCAACDTGVCACAAGACADCDDFAPTNNFVTTRSIAGWTLTGGWGLYREAPQNFSTGPVVFESQVFGTDANRIAPYPGADNENSSARTRATILPSSLEFLSWNVDEGSGVDTKFVRVSVDGGATFATIVDCTANPAAAPFCLFRSDGRAADDWDPVSLPLPPELVGQLGIVEFAYVAGDDCCGHEKGWFIDELNFATECACLDDEVCAGLGGECGDAQCAAVGECVLDPVGAGTACGDDAENQCTVADACDGVGYCASGDQPNGFTSCTDCPAGEGNCNACQEATCPDCVALDAVNDFNSGVPGWVFESIVGTSDWNFYSSAPPTTTTGSTPTALSFAPSFGTDGNRQAPYPGSETEHSRVTTPPDTVPDEITFSSWHVDEGTIDNKIIEISIDDGASWDVLVNCGTGIGVQVFCVSRVDPRAGTEWDAIVLDTSAYAGEVGQLRITYNTQDALVGSERGWFIDNLSFAQVCEDNPFP